VPIKGTQAMQRQLGTNTFRSDASCLKALGGATAEEGAAIAADLPSERPGRTPEVFADNFADNRSGATGAS